MLRDGTRFLTQAFRQYHYFSLRNQREGLRVTSVPLEIFFRKDQFNVQIKYPFPVLLKRFRFIKRVHLFRENCLLEEGGTSTGKMTARSGGGQESVKVPGKRRNLK